jgi:hypothetical protein
MPATLTAADDTRYAFDIAADAATIFERHARLFSPRYFLLFHMFIYFDAYARRYAGGAAR